MQIKPLIIERDTIKLLRIPFSLYLMPVFLLAFSQSESVDLSSAIWSFIIIHLLVYPASNGYNSFVDRDDSPIGGLENPPLPPRSLFFTTLALDCLALTASVLAVNASFALCILLYILASRAYSSKEIRLKKYPLTGFIVVVIFQGGFTFLMSQIGIAGDNYIQGKAHGWILAACSLQIAAAYPLTQIYQHEADRKSGVRTMSMMLGYRGTFIFSGIVFLLCNFCYLAYFLLQAKMDHFLLMQLFFIPVIAWYICWCLMVVRNRNAASYTNAMRMNMIASVCSGSCFITFILIKSFL
jgi:4-hydroxybenzoate polyprenyltransferase